LSRYNQSERIESNDLLPGWLAASVGHRFPEPATGTLRKHQWGPWSRTTPSCSRPVGLSPPRCFRLLLENLPGRDQELHLNGDAVIRRPPGLPARHI